MYKPFQKKMNMDPNYWQYSEEVLQELCQKTGGMAEWFKAAVLKTVVRKYRGFESYFLRQI